MDEPGEIERKGLIGYNAPRLADRGNLIDTLTGLLEPAMDGVDCSDGVMAACQNQFSVGPRSKGLSFGRIYRRT